MKLFGLSAFAVVSLVSSLVAAPVGAQTAIQAGEWETTEKTTMEGVQPMPPSSKKVCLKADEAQLERLLFPTPDEIKQHGCKYEPGAKKAGMLAATLTCPPNDQVPGVTARAEIMKSASFGNSTPTCAPLVTPCASNARARRRDRASTSA